MEPLKTQIKAIIGLGNPGRKYENTRHNIGFKVIDALAQRFHGSWQKKEMMEVASIVINGHKLLLIKPQTFMNSSGQVMPFLQKQGIKPENVLVIHDELELPLGRITLRFGGSHRGHNGLRSIIQYIGNEFHRLRFGIGRPEQKSQVSEYVLEDFAEFSPEVENLIANAADLVEDFITA